MIDRHIFLRLPGKTVCRFGWQLYAYCLMYTQAFNRRHARVGRVLQGRFDARLVERDRYLLELGRYIALNPVRAGFVPNAADWPWSSFRASAGVEPPPSWLALSPLLSMLHDDRAVATGQRGFRRTFASSAGKTRPNQDKPRAQRFAARPALELLLPAGLTKIQRDVAMAEAFLRHGYTLCARRSALREHSRIVRRADAEIQDLTPALQGG